MGLVCILHTYIVQYACSCVTPSWAIKKLSFFLRFLYLKDTSRLRWRGWQLVVIAVSHYCTLLGIFCIFCPFVLFFGTLAFIFLLFLIAICSVFFFVPMFHKLNLLLCDLLWEGKKSRTLSFYAQVQSFHLVQPPFISSYFHLLHDTAFILLL